MGVREWLGKLAGPKGSAFSEIGVGGASVVGGYVQPQEIGPYLTGVMRWRKASELLSNFSIIAASLRHFLNLTARPAWRAEPANESGEAEAVAEFIESVIHGTDTSWSRIVRRNGMFKFHGFGIHEWVAKKRLDGRAGLASIEPRPQHTIERWQRDRNGSVTGVWQRAPEDGREIFLPREKIVYLLDDTLSDSPEGLGWYRHLLKPAEQLERYITLEKIGFERDLSGIPIGRIPFAAIEAAVKVNQISRADADKMIKAMTDFVQLKSKQPDTGLAIESQPFTVTTDSGKSISAVRQWDLDLITGDSGKQLEALGDSINRITFDMALIMGTQSLLIGREGEGSRALSEDVSRNLYLNVNSSLLDQAEAYDRDIVEPICALNGIPEELKPTLRTEDASFRDIEKIARSLADMASAGAILAPDDPAIDDWRDLAGISRQPTMTPERMALIMGTKPSGEEKPPEDPEANPAKE